MCDANRGSPVARARLTLSTSGRRPTSMGLLLLRRRTSVAWVPCWYRTLDALVLYWDQVGSTMVYCTADIASGSGPSLPVVPRCAPHRRQTVSDQQQSPPRPDQRRWRAFLCMLSTPIGVPLALRSRSLTLLGCCLRAARVPLECLLRASLGGLRRTRAPLRIPTRPPFERKGGSG